MQVVQLGWEIVDMQQGKELKSRVLPIPLIKKNFVGNEGDCNYELYLRELLNSSQYFMEKSDGEKFVEPPNEAYGQCDAITSKYEVDFKLVESTSYLEAASQYSRGVQQLVKGVVAHTAPIRKGKTIVSKLRWTLREVASYEYIDRIVHGHFRHINMDKRSLENIGEQSNKDLQNFFNNVLMKKNLLLFLPEEFYFDENKCGLQEACHMIGEILTKDFSLSCQYRNEKVDDKDTYLCCLYDGMFVLYQFKEEEFVFVEHIETKESYIYTRLYEQYGIFY